MVFQALSPASVLSTPLQLGKDLLLKAAAQISWFECVVVKFIFLPLERIWLSEEPSPADRQPSFLS